MLAIFDRLDRSHVLALAAGLSGVAAFRYLDGWQLLVVLFVAVVFMVLSFLRKRQLLRQA